MNNQTSVLQSTQRLNKGKKNFTPMRTILLTLALVFVGVPACWAQGIATSAPVYNPATKSYFQLIENNRHSYVWDKAQAEAQTKVYKGVAGRLAVIDSPETHKFLVDHFDLRDPRKAIWIGLRYWCKLHMLQWEGARPYSPSDVDRFSFWHNPWSRGGSSCTEFRSTRVGYMPVYYVTVGSSTRWQATTASKGFHHYLVEYPTGHE